MINKNQPHLLVSLKSYKKLIFIKETRKINPRSIKIHKYFNARVNETN